MLHGMSSCLQYSGPVITLRVQYGLQIQYNTIMSSCRARGVMERRLEFESDRFEGVSAFNEGM